MRERNKASFRTKNENKKKEETVHIEEIYATEYFCIKNETNTPSNQHTQPLKFVLALGNCRGKSVLSLIYVGKLLPR